MPSAIGLRHPASASCLGRHLRLAGRCPNNSSLFPPLAAVVVVVLCAYSAEELFINRAMPGGLRTARHCIFTGGVVEENSICRAGFLRKQPRGGKNPLRLTAFASRSPFWLRDLPPTGGKSFHSGGAFCHLLVSANEAPPSGELARERLRGVALSLWESWHRVAMTERARVLTVCSSAVLFFS